MKKLIKAVLTTVPQNKTIVPVASKKKSSLKLSACSCSISRSYLLIAISEYEQEFGASVTVPFVYNRWFLSNKELILYKQICRPSNTHSVDGLFESLLFSSNQTVSLPLTVSMLGNMLTMSNDTKIISSGIPFSLIVAIISSK